MAIATTTILLCDDHPMVRNGFKQLLESAPDMQVICEAATGEEAYQCYRKQKAAVVVLDIVMPGMGGLAAARHILAYDAQARIVMLTMHESQSYAAQALKIGVKGYITKMAEPDELLKAIRLADKGRSYIQPSIAQALALSHISGEQDVLDLLSPREFEVFAALADGQSVKTISANLNLSPKTVGVHRTHIMKKLGADNLAEITRLAIRHGVITA